MNRRKTRGGHHRAQSPARASNTAIAAMCIISAIIASVIIFSVVILAGGSKKAIQISPRAVTRSSSPASPLGGDDLVSGKNPREVKGMDKPTHASVTTHILHDEPLEGGGQSDSRQASQDGSAAPQRSMWTTNATAYVRKVVAQQEAARVRADLVARINNFLGNSPLAGLGEYMVAEQERTTVSARLCCAVAREESQLGRICPPGNPFGMGPGMHFASWQAGITAWFNNCLKHPSWAPWQTGFDLQHPPYYCVLSDKVTPNPVYAPNITGLAESI